MSEGKNSSEIKGLKPIFFNESLENNSSEMKGKRANLF